MNSNDMNLYLLTQDEETGYDTYDSVVVMNKGVKNEK